MNIEPERFPSLVMITKADFDRLPNYSCTLPTGTTPGKQWKRAKDYHRQEDYHFWYRGSFGEPFPEGHEHYGKIPIHWQRIVVQEAPIFCVIHLVRK